MLGLVALFGLLRLYSTHQDNRGEKAPTIVRSMAEAFELLSLSEPKFEPVAMATAQPGARAFSLRSTLVT
jgi:hypothetical protein